MSKSLRRHFPRKLLDSEIYCYLAGNCQIIVNELICGRISSSLNTFMLVNSQMNMNILWTVIISMFYIYGGF